MRIVSPEMIRKPGDVIGLNGREQAMARRSL